MSVTSAVRHVRRAELRSRHDLHRRGRQVAAPTVSVVIPTLNEAKNLVHVLPRIPEWVLEVLIIDGRSEDRTVEVARRERHDVRVIRVETPGKGAAMRAGFLAARGDIVVALDADGSTDPRELPAIVGHLVAGADVALGTRFATGGGTADMELYRRAGNWVLTRMVRVAFGARYSDLCYGYVAFWRDVLPMLDGEFTGFEVETVLHIRAVRAGLRVAEVPSFEEQRIWGKSNLRTVRDGFRVLGSILGEWSRNRDATEHGDASAAHVRRLRRTDGRPSALPWCQARSVAPVEELV
jgi:glycosyltransferase involved in cell wall biosynthesis